jgi:creatinine amidohydrolase
VETPSLATVSWTDAAALEARVLAVPVGATEQHGPHLPLTTDTDIACALCAGLVDVVVAPPVSFGSSGEHADFPGTLSIGQAAIEELLVELGRSATRTWSRVLFVSTHGGNVAPVGRAVSRLEAEGRDVRAWMPEWGGDAHAGRTETSLMLAIAPETVNIEAAAPGETAPLRAVLARLVTEGVRAVSTNGVLGDPAGASADEGHALLAEARKSIRDVLAAWRSEALA